MKYAASAALLVMFLSFFSRALLAAERQDSNSRLSCGPIAAYVALTSLGHEVTLVDIADACGWDNGDPISLLELKKYFDSRSGISCDAVVLTSEQLIEYSSSDRCIVILAIKGRISSVGHVVCVVGQSTDEITLLDHPRGRRIVKVEDILGVWEGQALIVHDNSLRFFSTEVQVFFSCLILGVVFFAIKTKFI